MLSNLELSRILTRSLTVNGTAGDVPHRQERVKHVQGKVRLINPAVNV